jgi:hypothetical protein
MVGTKLIKAKVITVEGAERIVASGIRKNVTNDI